MAIFFHSLDIWHKSCKLTAKLSSVRTYSTYYSIYKLFSKSFNLQLLNYTYIAERFVNCLSQHKITNCKSHYSTFMPFACVFWCILKWCFFLSLFLCLLQTAKTRGCEGIKQWIEPVRNHFWHCTENCDGDEKALKVGVSLMYLLQVKFDFRLILI